MQLSVPTPHRRARVGVAFASSVALFTTVLMVLFAGSASAATVVPLGTAASYSVLAGSAVTNTGATTLQGDLGVSPGTAVSGFPPGMVGGVQHIADAPALRAQSDLTTAYNNAAGQGPTTAVAVELGGTTRFPGVYGNSTLGLTGTLTLDGQGATDGVFIFKTNSTLITASNSSVSLINGANPCNVFWQVGSSATLGTGTRFVGTILALQSITLNTGATLQGRALARNGAVTLDTNTITTPNCSVVPPTSTTPPPTTTTIPPTTTTIPPTTTTIPPTTTTVPPTTTTVPPTTTTTVPPTTTTVPPTTTTVPPTTTTTAPPTTTTTAPVTTTTSSNGGAGNGGGQGNAGAGNGGGATTTTTRATAPGTGGGGATTTTTTTKATAPSGGSSSSGKSSGGGGGGGVGGVVVIPAGHPQTGAGGAAHQADRGALALGAVALTGSFFAAAVAVCGRRRQLRLDGSTGRSADE